MPGASNNNSLAASFCYFRKNHNFSTHFPELCSVVSRFHYKGNVEDSLLLLFMLLVKGGRLEIKTSEYNYEIIKISILEWYEKVLSMFSNRDEIMLSKNDDDTLIIDFDFKNCIAQLSVTNSQYVPYQFVYFEAMDIEVPDFEEIIPIYSFHDDDTMQKGDVISALNKALLFCYNYKVK